MATPHAPSFVSAEELEAAARAAAAGRHFARAAAAYMGASIAYARDGNDAAALRMTLALQTQLHRAEEVEVGAEDAKDAKDAGVATGVPSEDDDSTATLDCGALWCAAEEQARTGHTNRFRNVAGSTGVKATMMTDFVMPLLTPMLLQSSGKGMILYGPPGTGKTNTTMAMVNEMQCLPGLNVRMLKVSAADIKGKYHGSTTANVRALFQCARGLVCALRDGTFEDMCGVVRGACGGRMPGTCALKKPNVYGCRRPAGAGGSGAGANVVESSVAEAYGKPLPPAARDTTALIRVAPAGTLMVRGCREGHSLRFWFARGEAPVQPSAMRAKFVETFHKNPTLLRTREERSPNPAQFAAFVEAHVRDAPANEVCDGHTIPEPGVTIDVPPVTAAVTLDPLRLLLVLSGPEVKARMQALVDAEEVQGGNARVTARHPAPVGVAPSALTPVSAEGATPAGLEEAKRAVERAVPRDRAGSAAPTDKPLVIVFLDEVESLLKARGGEDPMASLAVPEFLQQMEGGGANDTSNEGIVFVAATNLVHTLDDAFIRRMEKRVYMGPPSTTDLAEMLVMLAERRYRTTARALNIEVPDAADAADAACGKADVGASAVQRVDAVIKDEAKREKEAPALRALLALPGMTDMVLGVPTPRHGTAAARMGRMLGHILATARALRHTWTTQSEARSKINDAVRSASVALTRNAEQVWVGWRPSRDKPVAAAFPAQAAADSINTFMAQGTTPLFFRLGATTARVRRHATLLHAFEVEWVADAKVSPAERRAAHEAWSTGANKDAWYRVEREGEGVHTVTLLLPSVLESTKLMNAAMSASIPHVKFVPEQGPPPKVTDVARDVKKRFPGDEKDVAVAKDAVSGVVATPDARATWATRWMRAMGLAADEAALHAMEATYKALTTMSSVWVPTVSLL